MKDLDLEKVQHLAATGSQKTDLARRTVTANGIFFSSEDRAFSRYVPQTWNVEIETSSVTDQKNSGRCWLFASLNLLRHRVEKDFKIKEFELSQTYNYFFDKLEKANVFLELAWKYRNEPISSRHNSCFHSPQEDGGWFSEAAKLVDKYGVVPKNVMPESDNTFNSSNLNLILTRILRLGGLIMRDATDRAAAETAKQKILAEVYRVLSISLGEPPRKFSWSFRNSKKRVHKFTGSPQEFAKQFNLTGIAQQYVYLSDTPTLTYGKVYANKDAWSMAGDYMPMLNVELAKLTPLILAQLRDKEGVPVAIQSQRDMTRKNQGVMDQRVYDLDNLFGVDFTISRKNRMRSHEDLADHEVLIVGADAPHGAARWYKIENSWGKSVGDDGFWAMSAAWTDEYLHGVTIRRDLLPSEILTALKQKPIMLEPWEIYGE